MNDPHPLGRVGPRGYYTSHQDKVADIIDALLEPEALAALLLKAHQRGLIQSSTDDIGRPWFTVAAETVTYARNGTHTGQPLPEARRDHRLSHNPHTPPSEPPQEPTP